MPLALSVMGPVAILMNGIVGDTATATTLLYAFKRAQECAVASCVFGGHFHAVI